MSGELSTRDQVTRLIKETIQEISPEVDFSRINFEQELRDQIDLDSMDFFNWMNFIKLNFVFI